MRNPNTDPNFEEFRRERTRRRLESGAPRRELGDHSDTLRQIEQAEARETMDRQLTREVHEFFEAATKTAADIVHKVSEGQQAEAAEIVTQEVEDFLRDALSRMNAFVMAICSTRDPDLAEAHLETQVSNMAGSVLDSFRALGTARVADKHLGQDPFATETEAVERELQEVRTETDSNEAALAAAAASGLTSLPSLAVAAPAPGAARPAIESHLVAELHRNEEPDPPAGTPQAPARASADAQARDAATLPAVGSERERFKEVLKGLVRQGLMTRDEARAAWRAKTGAGV
jgi:hypothetical protein